MAKFILEFDTVEKTMSAELDGKKLDNVHSIEFFGGFSDDTFGMEVRSLSHDEESKVVTVTRLIAGEKDFETEEKPESLTESIAKRLFS